MASIFIRYRSRARESLPRDNHPNFYWLHEDYLVQVAKTAKFDCAIFRPSIMVGAPYGGAMGLAPAFGAYAAMCRELGEPCGYPGGPSFAWDATDARLVAKALHWAATSQAPAGETFNVTNGDVFEWRNLWPVLERTVAAEPGPDKPRQISKWMMENAQVWDRLVKRHGLRKLTQTELMGESNHYAEFCLACGATEAPPPAFMSAVKLHKAGFQKVQDTEEMFVHWLRDLCAKGVLPAA